MKIIYNLLVGVLGGVLLAGCWSMDDVKELINQAPEVTENIIDTTFVVKDNNNVQYIYTYGKEGKDDFESVYYSMTVSDKNLNLKNIVFLAQDNSKLSGTAYDDKGVLIENFKGAYEFTQPEQRSSSLRYFFNILVPCSLKATIQTDALSVRVITTDNENVSVENIFYYKNYKRLDGDIKIFVVNDTITATNRYTHFLVDYGNIGKYGLGQLTYKSRSTENIADFGRKDINFQTFRGAMSGKNWDEIDKNTSNSMSFIYSKGGSLPNIWVGENATDNFCPLKKRNFPYFFSEPDYKISPLYISNPESKMYFDDVVQTVQGQVMPYLEKENFLAPLEPFTTSPKDNTIPDNWEDIIVGQQALPLKYRIHVDFGTIERQLLKKYNLESKIRLEFTHDLEDAGLPEGQQTLSKKVGIESVVDNNAPRANTYMRERIEVLQFKNGESLPGLQYIHLLSDEMMINCIGELTDRYFLLTTNVTNIGSEQPLFKLYDQSQIRGDNGYLLSVSGDFTSLPNRLNSNLGIINRFFTLDGVQREENVYAPYFGSRSQAPTATTSLRVPERYVGRGMDYVRYAHRSFGVEFQDTVLVNQYDPSTGVYSYTSQVIRPHINKNLFTFGAGKGYEGRWSGMNSYNTQFKNKNLSKFETILYNAVTFTDPNGQDEYLRFRQQWLEKITKEDAGATKYYPYITKVWYTVDANQSTNVHTKTITYKESKVERGTLDFVVK